jgi:hypothetical protein
MGDVEMPGFELKTDALGRLFALTFPSAMA